MVEKAQTTQLGREALEKTAHLKGAAKRSHANKVDLALINVNENLIELDRIQKLKNK